MSKKPAKPARRGENDPAEGRIRLSRSVRHNIRRLKAEGRLDEAMALHRVELERKKAAARR